MIRQIIGLKCAEIVELESFETLPEKDLQPWEKGRCQSSYCDVPFGFPPLCTWSWIPHPHIHYAFRACQCRMNLCYQVSSIITLFQLCQCLYTFFQGQRSSNQLLGRLDRSLICPGQINHPCQRETIFTRHTLLWSRTQLLELTSKPSRAINPSRSQDTVKNYLQKPWLVGVYW